MADKSDIETRETDEVVAKLEEAGAMPDSGGTEQSQEQTTDQSGGRDGPAVVDNPFEQDTRDDPLEKDPMDVDGATRERLEGGREWMQEMVDAGNRVIQNQFTDDPAIEIVVPTAIYPEVEKVIRDARTEPGDRLVYGLGDASFTDNIDGLHPSAVTAFQFVLEEADDFGSSKYDIEGVIDAIEADDEPYMFTFSPLIGVDEIPLDPDQ